jgi:hypothetical protein
MRVETDRLSIERVLTPLNTRKRSGTFSLSFLRSLPDATIYLSIIITILTLAKGAGANAEAEATKAREQAAENFMVVIVLFSIK